MKKFTIPGYFTNFNLVKLIIEYQDLHPNFFYSDRIIDSSYDFPRGMAWNGGRSAPFGNFDEIYLYNVIQYYTHSSIKLKHTCTNLFIDEEMTHEYYCNYWLKLFEKEGNSVILTSEILKQYIEKKYPLYNIIYSTMLSIHDPNKINELTNKGYMVVLDYNDNHNFDFLSKIKQPAMCEILCAETCEPNCPYRKEHEQNTSHIQLWDFSNYSGCISKNHFAFNFYETQKLSTAITNQDIEKLYQMGFCNFKISGRKIKPHQWIEHIIYYLIKPEYQNGVRQDLLNIYYNNYDITTLFCHYKG